MNSSQHPDAASFLSQLIRFRRRLAFVTLVGYLPIAAAISIVATGASALAAHPAPGQRLTWFAAGVGLALALAGIIALARTPSLGRAAATLDQRFGLDDRTVTALEFASDADSVSQLIVTDASAHLAAHATRELSFEFPKRPGWIAVGVVAVFLAVAVGWSPQAPDARTSGQDSAAKTGKGASGLTRPAPAPAPTDAEGKAEGSTASRGLAGEPAARARQNESPLAAQPRANPTPDGSAAQKKSSSNQSAAGSAATEARRGEGGNTQGPAGGSTSRGAERSGAGNARNDRGAGPGGRSVAGLEAGTGGVNGAVQPTQLPSLPPPPARPPDADSSYAARFRRAWTHAESPVAQERIPAGLRAYVRDYFLAIRPNGQP